MDRKRQACDRILMALLGSTEMIEGWWNSNNKAFDNETPNAVWATNKDRVILYLLAQLNADFM